MDGRLRISLCVAFVLLFLIAASAFAAGTKTAESLRGEPFSDPAAVQKMSPEWEKKPIKYKPSVGKADLVVTLSQQFHEFMVPYIEKYASEHGLEIFVSKGTCGISAGMLSRKKGDIGAFCCPPGKTDRLPGLGFYTVGVHPISILVHPDNPVDNVSFDQLRKIYQGDIVRWSELGWDNRPIQPVARLHCKKRPGHWRLMLKNEDLFGPEVKEVGAIEDMFSLVSTIRGAVGYAVMNLSKKKKGSVKILKIDGHSPEDIDHLLTGGYPLYRALYITLWEQKHLQNPHSKKLVEYIVRQVEIHGAEEGIVSVSRLRKAGWKFRGNELVGEPDQGMEK